MRSVTEEDKVICPHCSGVFKLKEASFWSARFFRIGRGGRPTNVPMQVVDTWNAPHTTGLFILSRDEVPKDAVEAFANEKARFPFWSLEYLGKLWCKNTWDD